ncbi:HNH endonuclease [Mycobacterium sp. NPDC050441]|uniref:HNH endonuclease n=1 Tax=Mycobacterium sp. NPDC050441 TaxID=3155403 RepID=UPI0033CC6C54
MFESLAKVDSDADEAALRDRIAELERLKAAAAAGQARATVAMESARHSAEAATRVPVARRGRGLGTEIGLARMDSPANGRQHLSDARILVLDLPHTLAALETGVLTEARARLIVREAACLSPADRRRLDHELCADPASLIGLGDTHIRSDAKPIAYQVDPISVIDRATRAPEDRTVTFRPAADNMAIVTALLPATDAASVRYTLTEAADRCADGRNRGQTMADTLVTRVTGRDTTTPVPVAVNLVLSDDTLLAGSTQPAHLQGHGPIPAAAARRMIRDALVDDNSWATLRRLYATPGTGTLVAMESRSRRFPKGLARFIATRDRTCRTPYCNAPIRHIDHVQPHHRNGPTSAANGQGLCEHCNYVKEHPGWQVRTRTDESGRHTTEHITPTGATYRSTAPPLAGGLRVLTREVHVVVNKRAA